jgi:hypothetical protein
MTAFIDAYKAETPDSYPSVISLFGFVAGMDAVTAVVQELLASRSSADDP